MRPWRLGSMPVVSWFLFSVLAQAADWDSDKGPGNDDTDAQQGSYTGRVVKISERNETAQYWIVCDQDNSPYRHRGKLVISADEITQDMASTLDLAIQQKDSDNVVTVGAAGQVTSVSTG